MAGAPKGPAFSEYLDVTLGLRKGATLTIGDPHKVDGDFQYYRSFIIFVQMQASKKKNAYVFPKVSSLFQGSLGQKIFLHEPRTSDL